MGSWVFWELCDSVRHRVTQMLGFWTSRGMVLGRMQPFWSRSVCEWNWVCEATTLETKASFK